MTTRVEKAQAQAEKELRRLAPDLPSGAPDDRFDRENAFQLYATFCGDVERTAHALGIQPVDVCRVADEGAWSERLRAIFALKKSTKPGDLERGLNRAMNFVQAQRMRLFIGRLLKKFSMMDETELDNWLFSTVERHEKGENGATIIERKINTKSISDLAAAMEKCHQMSYAALNDTASERVNRGDEQERETSATELHQQLAQAMGQAAGDQSPRAKLFDEQLKVGQDLQERQQLQAQLDKALDQ
jgi:hypothetical protein